MRTSEVRGTANRAMWLATLGFFGGFAGVAIFGPLVPEFTDEMGLSPIEAGLLAAVPNLTGSLLRIPFGAWVDKVGGRKPFLTLLGLSLIGMLGLMAIIAAWWPDDMDGKYPYLLIVGALIGCGIASFSVGIAQVSYWFPRGRQGGPLGVYGGLGNTAPGLSSLALPAVVGATSTLAAYGMWTALLVGITLIYAFYMRDAPAFQLRAQKVPVTREVLDQHGEDLLIPSGSAWEGLRLAARKRATWLLVYFYFISFGGFLALVAWLPTYWKETFEVSTVTGGFLTLIFGVTSALVRVPGGLLSDRISIRYALTGNFLLIGLSAAVVAFAGSLGLAVAAVVLIAIGMGLQNAIVFKLVPHYVPDAVGGAAGWVGGLGALSGFLLPLAMGAWTSQLSGDLAYARPFLLVTALVVVGLVLVGALTRWTWSTRLEESAA